MPKIDLLSEKLAGEKRRTVILTITHDCNLRCRYCYEPNKARDYMNFSTAQQAVVEYMGEEDEFNAIEFEFSGGEPMLAFDLIRDLVDWFHTRTWPKKHIFYIGTNGTILTDDMETWLVNNKECVCAGVSLDGNKVAQDINRSNSYDAVMRNLPFFMEQWPMQGVKMTISAESIPYVADSIIELEEKEIPFSSNIVFENIWGTPEQKPILLDVYAQQLERLVQYYAAHPDLVPARIVDVKVEYLAQDRHFKDVENYIRTCGAGHEMVAVNVDGSRSPCHRFGSWITGKPIPNGANYQKTWGPKKCAECRLIELCPVCAGFNWQENGDTSIRTTYHCDSFKLETQASAKLQALRLLQQKPEDIAKLPSEEAYKLKVKIDALLDIAENGV